MPNHVTTVCFVSGPPDDVDRFIAAHIHPVEARDGETKSRFDFETIVPMPECARNVESSSLAENGFFALTGMHKITFARFSESPMHLAAAHSGFPMNPLTTPDDYRAWLAERTPDALVKGQHMLDCFRQTGFLSWYDWSLSNWGTKWNSYGYEERSREPGRFVFKFETAWSVPKPIFEALIGLYPALTFDLQSVDDGGPQYVGHYSTAEQKLEEVPESRERYRLAYGRDPHDDDDESN